LRAFTNLGRDHMDYHPTMDDYMAAKMRLFDTLAAERRAGGDLRRRSLVEKPSKWPKGRCSRCLTVGRKGGFSR
jgi:hypothetical protein